MNTTIKTNFAPQLYIPKGVKDIRFYMDAFGASELRRWENEDGSIHVAELSIDGAMFHLHEEKEKGFAAPGKTGSTTVTIGLFTADVDAVMKRAVNAGAKEISPAQDYEYSYRQGQIQDPFGHHWLIEKNI